MTRARSIVAAALAGASFVCAPGLAHTQNPPPMQSILAGKKFTPPIKGVADVEFAKPDTKRVKDMVITKITVKNISNAPIARLTVFEIWYGKDQQMVTGGKGFINGLLQPGEVKTVEIQTPYNPKMNSNNWNFTHANGDVKPHSVKTLVDPNAPKKEPAAKNASATKGKKK